MKDSFEELVLALKQNRKKCPWSNDVDFERFVEELAKEVDEVKQAIKNKDYVNLQEEIGDLLMDTLFLGIIAEEKGLFTIKNSLDDVITKLKRRKPWVFGDEVITTKEQATKRWNEIKAKWIYNYRNKKEVKMESIKKCVSAEDEWCAEAYMKTEYSKLTNETFEKEIKKYILFKELN